MSTNFDKFAQITNWMMLLEKKNTAESSWTYIQKKQKH